MEGRCPQVKTRETKMDVTEESHAESKHLCLLTGEGVGGEKALRAETAIWKRRRGFLCQCEPRCLWSCAPCIVIHS